VDRLADRNEEYFAHEVAGWTRGRPNANEIGIELLRRWFPPRAQHERS
jgi:hypothetical protein